MSKSIDDVTSDPDYGFTTQATPLLSHLSVLPEFQVSRDDTYRWVYQDMKFLVCDESDDSEGCGNEQHPDLMLPPLPAFPGRAAQGHFGVQGNWRYLRNASDGDMPLVADFDTLDSHPMSGRSNSSEAIVSADIENPQAVEQGSIPSCVVCSRFRRFPSGTTPQRNARTFPVEAF